MHNRSFALLAAHAILLGAPSPGLSQVSDTTLATDSAIAIAPVVVTTTRLPVVSTRGAFAVRVVDAAELRARAPRSAVDLFRDEPGIFVDESVGPGGPTILRIRGGEEVFTQVLVDGVQVNQNGGFFDILGFRLSNLDRVEIARGPQSAIHGSSAVSGLVQFVTPVGPVGAPRFRGTFEGGSATDHGGRWNAEAAVRGGSERLRYSAGVGAGYSRGVWDVPNDTRNRDGSLRLDYLPTDSWSLGLVARNVFVESGLPVRDVGVTRAALDPNARDEFDRSILSLTARHQGPGRTSHALTVSRFGEKFVFEDEFDGVTGPADAFVFDANLRFQADLTRTTARYSGSATGPAPSIDLAWGAQWERETLGNEISGDFEDELALDRNSTAVFGELGWRPGRLSVVAGVRAEKFEGLDWELTPRLGASWQVGDGVVLRSSVGRAYKAPNLQQQFVDNPFVVANPDIRAETSVSAEVGLDLGRTAGPATGSLTVFRQTFDDLIRTVGIEGQSQQTNRNVGEALARGIEWTGSVRLADRVRLGTTGAWVETEVVDNVGLPAAEYPTGEALPFRPELVAGAFIEGRGADAWTLRLRLTRVGGQEVLSNRFSGARVGLDGYTLVGASGWYALRTGVRLFGRLDNLFDASYFTSFDRPGAPGSASLGVEWAF